MHIEYIVSINNSGRVERWECSYSGRAKNTLVWSKVNDGGNADKVDGKHADDFIINYGIVDDVNDYCCQTNPCVIKWNRDTLNTPLKKGLTSAVTGVIYVNTVNTGWTTMLAIPDGQNNIFIKSFKGTNIITDWESLRNADTLDNKHASDFATSIEVQELSEDFSDLKNLVIELTKLLNNYNKVV